MASLDWENLEAADRIAKMSDDVMLTTEEAAVFLRTSVRTLERMRSSRIEGAGPNYHQATSKGIEGFSQVRYRLGDLKAWLDSNRVGSTIEAGIRKGRL